MSYIDPVFSKLADPQAAMAFSEVVSRQGEFKVETLDSNLDDNGQFPPVPAYLTAMCSAYWETTPEGPNVRRQVIIMEEEPNKRCQIADQFRNAYDAHVGSFHEIATDFESSGVFLAGNVAIRAAELAHIARLRTVAAFTLFHAADTGETLTGLLIPTKTFTQLPLEDRDQLRKFVDAIQDDDHDVFAEVPMFKETYQRVMQNDPAHARFAFMGAAMNLPDSERVDKSLRFITNNQTSSKQTNISRAERRAQALRERRAKRRGNQN